MKRMKIARIATAVALLASMSISAIAADAKKAVDAVKIKHAFRVAVNGTIVAFDVSGNDEFTFTVPNDGGTITVSRANLAQRIGEGAANFAAQHGKKLSTDRQKFTVTFSPKGGGKVTLKDVRPCNGEPNAVIGVDFDGQGVAKVCAIQ